MDRRLSFGRTHGNGNPTRTLLRLRKRNGRRGSHILLFSGKDPTYSHIEGKWLNEAPYGVIHRLASNGKAKGIARQCIAWCFARHHNLRADTHTDNLIMQNLLKTNGFRERGIIYTRQSPRIAYQKVTDAAPSGFQA